MQESSSSVSGKKPEKRMTFTSLLTIVVLVVGAVCAAYVYGVMTGRKAALPNAIEVTAPIQEELPDSTKENILRPQDLEFAQVLRGEERRSPPAPVTPPAPVPPLETPVSTMEQRTEEPVKAPVKIPEIPAGFYDYVFQLAALRDAQAADQLRENLEGYGLRTRLDRSGQFFLVLVLLRGDSERVDELFNIARSLKLGEPLLRVRKPISR